MDWEFSEDTAFIALCAAFRESGEKAAIEFSEIGWGKFKTMLTESLISALEPIQNKYDELTKQNDNLKSMIVIKDELIADISKSFKEAVRL